MRQVLLIVTIITISSCNRVVSRLLGVRPPRVETIESIQSFCKRKGINDSNVLIIKTEDMIKSFYENLNMDLLFDRNGYLLKYSDGFSDAQCGGNILLTTKSIPPVSYIERDSTKLFTEYKKTWMPLNDTLASVSVNCSDADYTIVIYWNMFCGSPNHKKRIEAVYEYVKLNTASKIQIVLVNQDIRPVNGEVIVFDKKK
jgi:hypothetical protein